MAVDTRDVLVGIVIGIGATLVMDLWNLFLKRTFKIQSLNYCLLGRWLCHMPSGTFRHASIGAAGQKPFECTVGWIAHYSIGVTLALVFVVPVLCPATVTRSRRRFITSAQSNAREAQEPDDTQRIRRGTVCVWTRCEVHGPMGRSSGCSRWVDPTMPLF